MTNPCSADARIHRPSTNRAWWRAPIRPCVACMGRFLVFVGNVVLHSVRCASTWADEWFGYPLVLSLITLPGSIGRLKLDLFSWLPPGGQVVVACLTTVAFWPCYITFLVLWVKKGNRTHFAVVAAMSLLASIYWHYLSIAASGI